mgnify:CR=1 FL=1
MVTEREGEEWDEWILHEYFSKILGYENSPSREWYKGEKGKIEKDFLEFNTEKSFTELWDRRYLIEAGKGKVTGHRERFFKEGLERLGLTYPEDRFGDLAQYDLENDLPIDFSLLPEYLIELCNRTVASERLRYYYELRSSGKINEENLVLYTRFPIIRKLEGCYSQARPEDFRDRRNQVSRVKDIIHHSMVIRDIRSDVLRVFEIGKTYSRGHIKKTLQEIYQKYGSKITSKSTDIYDYFNVIGYRMIDPETGKRVNGFGLLEPL